jgi:uncharacterized membrane protein (DUF4010 family)
VSFSRRGRDNPGERDLLAAGILVSTATMLPRTAVIAGVIAPALISDLAIPLAAGAVSAYVAGLIFAGRGKPPDARTEESPRNPLDLKTALQFAVILIVVLLLAHGAEASFGEFGLYGLAVLSGLIDIDAATLSLAAMAGAGRTTAEVAGGAIVVAAGTNVAIKAAIVFMLGGSGMAVRIVLGLCPTLFIIALGFYLALPSLPGAG